MTEVKEKESQATIIVGVRLRPFVGHEKGQRQVLTMTGGNTVTVVSEVASEEQRIKGYADPSEAKQFAFDHAMDSSNQSSPSCATQEKCYNLMARCMVKHVFEGFNTCLFCYGQTGTGKTMTIMGNIESETEQGLLVRLLNDVFKEIQSHERKGGDTFELRVQIIEVYNEKIQDLLREDKEEKKKLDVHVHPQLGVYMKGVNEVVVTSFQECVEHIEYGNSMKSVAATQMNANSSRGHTVFKMKMERRDGTNIVTSEVFFVDLAGRENEKTTKVSGERFIELSFINKSLMWLAQCIQQLGDTKSIEKAASRTKSKKDADDELLRPQVVRKDRDMSKFRNSKLTLLLSNALSGNSKTSMIGTLSPAAAHFEESLATIKFAATVKNIKLEAKVKTGHDAQASAGLIAALQEEIRLLKEQMRDCPSAVDRTPSQSSMASQCDLEELQQQLECAQTLKAEFQDKLESERADAYSLQRKLEDEQAGALALQRKFQEEHAEGLLLQQRWEKERADSLNHKKKFDDSHAENMKLREQLEKFDGSHAENMKLREKLERSDTSSTTAAGKLVGARLSLAITQKKLDKANEQLSRVGKMQQNGGDGVGREMEPRRSNCLAMPCISEDQESSDVDQAPSQRPSRIEQEFLDRNQPPTQGPASKALEALVQSVDADQAPTQPPDRRDQDDLDVDEAPVQRSARRLGSWEAAQSTEVSPATIAELRRQLDISRQLCQEYRNKWESEREGHASVRKRRQETVVQLACCKLLLFNARAKLSYCGGPAGGESFLGPLPPPGKFAARPLNLGSLGSTNSGSQTVSELSKNMDGLTSLSTSWIAEAGTIDPEAFAAGALSLRPITSQKHIIDDGQRVSMSYEAPPVPSLHHLQPQTSSTCSSPRSDISSMTGISGRITGNVRPMKGFLWKKSPSQMRIFGNAWDRRFVTLISGRLSWMEGENGTAVSGFVDLPCNTTTVETILASTTEFRLHVQGGKGNFTGGSVRTFLFDAEGSSHNRENWISGIKEHMRCELGSSHNDWAKQVIRCGSLKFLSGKWLFRQVASGEAKDYASGGLSAVANRTEGLPMEAYIDPGRAAQLYEECGCLVILS